MKARDDVYVGPEYLWKIVCIFQELKMSWGTKGKLAIPG